MGWVALPVNTGQTEKSLAAEEIYRSCLLKSYSCLLFINFYYLLMLSEVTKILLVLCRILFRGLDPLRAGA